MKRVLCVCAIAALVMAIPATVATAQTWEIHQYFSGAGTSAPVGTPANVNNANLTINATPGQTVYLPVWIRMQPGDGATLLTNFTYGVSGVATGAALPANFLPDAAGTSNRTLGDYATPRTDLGGVPIATNAPTGNFGLVAGMGYGSSTPASTNVIGASGSTLAPTSNGAWWVGTVAITIAPGAPTSAGSGLDLYFKTAGVQYGTPYGTTQQTAATTSLGYGWDDAAGTPDFHRFNSGGATVLVGRGNDLFSSFADAHINIIPVPEPGTLALLAMGLIGLRRRHA